MLQRALFNLNDNSTVGYVYLLHWILASDVFKHQNLMYEFYVSYTDICIKFAGTKVKQIVSVVHRIRFSTSTLLLYRRSTVPTLGWHHQAVVVVATTAEAEEEERERISAEKKGAVNPGTTN